MCLVESIDIYAYTNPTFLTLNMEEFLRGYGEKKEECFFPLLYLIAPVVLSNKINKHLLHTNKKTEFISWLYKHPDIKLSLPQMIDRTKKYSNKAIVFGSQIGIFKVNENGYISTITNKSKVKISKNNEMYLKYSHRLGYWIANLDESQLFLHIGVTL